MATILKYPKDIYTDMLNGIRKELHDIIHHEDAPAYIAVLCNKMRRQLRAASQKTQKGLVGNSEAMEELASASNDIRTRINIAACFGRQIAIRPDASDYRVHALNYLAQSITLLTAYQETPWGK